MDISRMMGTAMWVVEWERSECIESTGGFWWECGLNKNRAGVGASP